MQKLSKYSNIFYFLLIAFVFCIGIYLRTKTYLTNQSFWHDECALAWNIINRSYTELLQPLRFLQAAPCLFLIDTKFWVNHFGTNELVFRFIPYLSGIFSIIAFYFLSKNILNTKLSVFFANLIFATSFPLYYYSSEFKPYSSDVLLCIFTLLLYQDLNKRNLFITSVILSILIWYSFPAVFLIPAIICCIFLEKQYNLKEKFLFLIPQILSGLIFYKIFFINMFNSQKAGMTNYWQNDFLNIHNLKFLFNKAYDFMFFDGNILLFISAIGLFLFLKEKDKFGKFALFLFSVLITASFLNLYPFSGRLILFLTPIIILLIVKAFDKKNIISMFLLILFLIGIYPQIKNTKNTILQNNYNKNNSNPREMVQYLSTQIKENDIVYVNTDSNSDYLYYKQLYKIKNKEYINTPQHLNKNDYIWFFLPNNAALTYEQIINKDYKILYENKNKDSLLIYAKKLK